MSREKKGRGQARKGGYGLGRQRQMAWGWIVHCALETKGPNCTGATTIYVCRIRGVLAGGRVEQAQRDASVPHRPAAQCEPKVFSPE